MKIKIEGAKPTAILDEVIRKGDFGDEPLPENCGRIRFLCTTEQSKEITGNGIGGHDRIIWDKRYEDQIEEARDKFYELLDKGWMAFLTMGNGEKGKRIFEFDYKYEEILMTTPVVGG